LKTQELFGFCGLDLYPLKLILNNDLDIMNMYLCTKPRRAHRHVFFSSTTLTVTRWSCYTNWLNILKMYLRMKTNFLGRGFH